MINNEKNVTVEKDDLKIWLNSTAPPGVDNCPYYLLISEQLVKKLKALTYLASILLFQKTLD